MSGGSYDYACFTVEQQYVGKMFDTELDEMMKDLVDILYDLEWWQSCDIGEERYRKTVEEFKGKWLGKRDEKLRERLVNQLEAAKKEVLER